MNAPPGLLGIGDRAPRFTVPAVHHDGTISLDDYLGKTPLLLALFRGVF